MEYGIFEQLLTIIVLSVIVIAIFRRLSLPSILGYLAVGIFIAIIDRYAFKDIQSYNILAKYGVVFLLFTIGLEFSTAKLIALKRIVFLLGSLQVAACTAIFWAIGILFGMSVGNAFIVGATLSLSSTAMISKVLSEAGEVQTQTGRMTIGVLIFQDIMVVPLLIITSILANNSGQGLLQHISVELIIGILTFFIIYFVGRLIITPLFKEVARSGSNELFILAAFLTALGAAYFSDMMGMSKELGAFLAGVILAGTPYHKQVANDIRPFRDVLLGLFFIGIGMSLNISTLNTTGGWILLVGTLLVLVKIAIIPLIILFLKLADRQQAFRTGILLSQAGEFGFVLIAVATNFKLIQDFHGQIIIGSIIFSMILSLVIVQIQKPFSRWLANRRGEKPNTEKPNKAQSELPHIIICGFGYTGQQVASVFKAAGLPFNAIDTNATRVSQASMAGEPVYYGNASDREMLLSLGLKNALAVVVCFNSENLAREVHNIVHEETQRTPLILRVKMKSGDSLPTASNLSVIDEGIEVGMLLGKQTLNAIGFKPHDIARISYKVKQTLKYDFFRGDETLLDSENIDKPQRYSFRVDPNAAICGRSLQTVDIDTRAIRLKAIRRQGRTLEHTHLDTPIEAGDVLVITGLLDHIESFEEAVNAHA
ncbi:MAG: hypothetical protein COV52_06830 [Gammaproteobacteria bacterium CG11_big_fil_rev_8_21_14_0_20_46_22]|nr:MAG: hypothetical protein COW05_02370 [Gammaproteobacteria bacterium CG12_big_fil_rev_8_21_14_0_65_46_12]PIR10754.1 MAG: hypothetical protein COV52_06830 [Gammaproteobacteria bacterium CG11_big_fil_rev_8_21_14_0_20_46_22]